MSNKHERFDTIVGSMIFFLLLGLPIVLWIFGVGDGAQPLSNTY